MVATIIVLVLIIIILGIIGYGIYKVTSIFRPKELGESCSVPTDCANANLFVGSPGVTCCQGTCQQKKRDWANQWYCPNECVGIFAGRPGTC